MPHPASCHWVTALSLVVALASGEARADTLKVPSEAFPTIQAAVDAAQDGDEILIASGLYEESVTVTTSGVTLRGKGSVRLAGSAPGAALTLDGHGITVRRLRIIASEGNGVAINGNDARLERCRIQDVPGNAVTIAGDGASIDRCTILRPGGDGGRILGSGGYWLRTNIVEPGGNGILEIAEIGVSGNRYERVGIRRAAARGIRVEGDAAHVLRCRIVAPGNDGIRAHGADNIIEHNLIVSVGDDGIEMDGHAAIVHRNRVLKAVEDGIEIDGDDGFYDYNRVAKAGSNGIQLSEGVGNLLSFNRAKGSGEYDLFVSAQVEGENEVDGTNKFKTTFP